MWAQEDAVDQNPKLLRTNPASLPAKRLPEPAAFGEPEESTGSDYWSSPFGMAVLADLDEDDD